MLIRFIVENFLSFNKESEFSLIANKERRKPEHLIRTKDISLLKTAVIYGANASGKTNLVRAIATAQGIVLRGIDKVNTINCHYRLKELNLENPSKFIFEIKIKECYYTYGFGVLLDKNVILEEWLYEIGKSKEKKIFERYRDDAGVHHIDIGLNLSTEGKSRFEVYKADMANSDNFLFLSELNRKSISTIKNIDPIIDVYHWFNNRLTVLFPSSKYTGLDFVGDDDELKKVFNVFLDVFKTGISNVVSEKVDVENFEFSNKIKSKILKDLEIANTVILEYDGKRYSVRKDESNKLQIQKIGLEHKTQEGEKVIFDIENESDGTQRLFDFIPALHQSLNSDKVFVIDELDRSLHSKLTYELINIFLYLTDKNESQLIVTTHESLLLDLDLLRKDEIWFIEKEDDSSKLYSLDEFKVRNDKIIRKDYLLGRYGAIPIFKSFKNIHELEK